MIYLDSHEYSSSYNLPPRPRAYIGTYVVNIVFYLGLDCFLQHHYNISWHNSTVEKRRNGKKAKDQKREQSKQWGYEGRTTSLAKSLIRTHNG